MNDRSITEQLTSAVSTVTLHRISHDCSFVILPIELAEFPSECPGTIPLSLFVAKSTAVVCYTFDLLETFTVRQVPPLAPGSVNNFLLADCELSLLVVGYHLVGQSLAPVGLLDRPDTELGFLVY